MINLELPERLEGVSTLKHDDRVTTRSGYGVILRYDGETWSEASSFATDAP